MRRFFLPLTLALALSAMAIPACSAERPDPAQGQQERRVWTNEDLEDLRARGLISIIGTVPEAAPAALPQAARYSNRTEDPAWYAGQASELQTQLNERMAALLLARQSLVQARSLRQTTAGINLAQANAGITPEEDMAVLEARVSEVQSRFDELADLARRNYIPPGLLRPSLV